MSEVVFNPYKLKGKSINFNKQVTSELTANTQSNAFSFNIFRKKISKLGQSFTSGQVKESERTIEHPNSKPSTNSKEIGKNSDGTIMFKKSPTVGDTIEGLQKPARKSLARQIILSPATNLFSSLAGVSRKSGGANISREGTVNRTIQDCSSDIVKPQFDKKTVDIRQDIKPKLDFDPNMDNKRAVLQSLLRSGLTMKGSTLFSMHRKTKSNSSFTKTTETMKETSPLRNKFNAE